MEEDSVDRLWLVIRSLKAPEGKYVSINLISLAPILSFWVNLKQHWLLRINSLNFVQKEASDGEWRFEFRILSGAFLLNSVSDLNFKLGLQNQEVWCHQARQSQVQSERLCLWSHGSNSWRDLCSRTKRSHSSYHFFWKHSCSMQILLGSWVLYW